MIAKIADAVSQAAGGWRLAARDLMQGRGMAVSKACAVVGLSRAAFYKAGESAVRHER